MGGSWFYSRVGEHSVSPRFYYFFYDVNQGNEGDGLKCFLVPAEMERHSLDLLRAVQNILGYGSV